jgi:ribosomal protein L9
MSRLEKEDFATLTRFMQHNIHRPFNPNFLVRFKKAFPVLMKDYEKLVGENGQLLKENRKLKQQVEELQPKLLDPQQELLDDQEVAE